MARSKRNAQVVLAKNMIKSLYRFANAHKAVGYALSPKTRKYFSFEKITETSCDALPRDVPKGHCAVYVGNEHRRFIIPTSYLNHSLFQELLDKAAEEYGFGHQMGLIIPCEEVAFQYLISMVGEKDQH